MPDAAGPGGHHIGQGQPDSRLAIEPPQAFDVVQLDPNVDRLPVCRASGFRDDCEDVAPDGLVRVITPSGLVAIGQPEEGFQDGLSLRPQDLALRRQKQFGGGDIASGRLSGSTRAMAVTSPSGSIAAIIPLA